MSKPLQLAAFDYDGTITDADSTSIAADVLSGINALWQAGVKTTVITARPYRRLIDVSGGVNKIVSKGAPFATERGARIIEGSQLTNLHYFPLNQAELAAIIQLPGANIDFIGFYPEDILGTSFIWAPDTKQQYTLNAKFGHDAVVLAGDVKQLDHALRVSNPCLVTIRFKTADSANKSLLPASLNTSWTDRSVTVITSGISKRTALNKLCLSMNVPLHSTLYAGNDENDLPVFDIPNLNNKVIVGPFVPKRVMPHTKVASPRELGMHFKNISKELL